MRTPFTGCGTALVTPFTSSGAVDEAGVRRLARRQVEAGVHFLVPCGTTGEAPTLTPAEERRVVEIVVEEARGRVPVLAGAGGYDTREVVEAARAMHGAGADGLLSVTPYYNKPTPDGLCRHYEAIAEATPLPIVVYNVPGRTGCNVDPATLVRLASIPHVTGVKEASGNVTQICEVLRAVPADFVVLSGDDALTLPAMAVGARGVISVASNECPAEMAQARGGRRAERLRRGTRGACPPSAPDARQLRRVQPHPGEGRDGADGPAGGDLPPPHGPASRRDAGEAPPRPRRGRPRAGGGARVSERLAALRARIERLFAAGPAADRDEARAAFAELREALSRGEARAAEPFPASPTGWRVNAWVKQGILLGFRHGDLKDASMDHGRLPFFDKDTLPLKRLDAAAGVRIVPGGSSVRDGAFLGRGVICMPPMYVNVGAYVDEGSMIDSHALVGSCAQVGRHVHVSAGAQIGGVLEPVGALPVCVEDDVLLGGLTGLFEGTVVKRRAVIAAGTILTGSTPVYDLPNGRILRPEGGAPMVIPEGAVVVPGSRAVTVGAGREWGLSLATPVIVKYRDEKTDARTELEKWLR